MNGGGSDDTLVLQGILDRARDGMAVQLVVDGPALISGLDVYGHTTIECTAGGGLYLKDDSDRAIIRNAHRSRKNVTDEHIAIRGCFLNGNRNGQRLTAGRDFAARQEPDGTFKSGLQFLGANYVSVQDVTIWNARSFGAWFSNAKYIDIRNVIVDTDIPPFDETLSAAEQRNFLDRVRSNDDGLHFNGPIQYLTIDGVKLRTEDDGIGLNANDWSRVDDMTLENKMGPYVGQGPIVDVTVRNVLFMDSLQGIRLVSSNQRIDRIVIENVSGTVRGRMAVVSANLGKPPHIGNFGFVSFSHVSVQPAKFAKMSEIYSELMDEKYGDLGEEFEMALFSVNSPIENLTLDHVVTRPVDDRPLIRIGHDAAIDTMNVQMSINDPALQAVPLELVAGGRIERLNIALDWKGKASDQGKNPMQSNGGIITQLHWLNTPPMFVGAQLTNGNVLVVTFSQDVKAADFKAGVTIKVNGKSVEVSSAARQRERDVVRYILKAPLSVRDAVTWTYCGADGAIQNLSGDQLLSVSGRVATIH